MRSSGPSRTTRWRCAPSALGAGDAAATGAHRSAAARTVARGTARHGAARSRGGRKDRTGGGRAARFPPRPSRPADRGDRDRPRCHARDSRCAHSRLAGRACARGRQGIDRGSLLVLARK